MNFYELNIVLALSIVGIMLLITEILLPYTKLTKKFFILCQPVLSANNISRLRAPLGVIISLIIFFFFDKLDETSATILIQTILFLAISDRLDGQVARTLGQTSEYGKKLDALCDKWFDLPILLALSWQVHWSLFTIVLFIVGFDITGQTLRSQMSDPAAQNIGKIKTICKFILIFALFIFLFKAEIQAVEYLFESLFIATIICMIFTFWSMAMKVKGIMVVQQNWKK